MSLLTIADEIITKIERSIVERYNSRQNRSRCRHCEKLIDQPIEIPTCPHCNGEHAIATKTELETIQQAYAVLNNVSGITP